MDGCQDFGVARNYQHQYNTWTPVHRCLLPRTSKKRSSNENGQCHSDPHHRSYPAVGVKKRKVIVLLWAHLRTFIVTLILIIAPISVGVKERKVFVCKEGHIGVSVGMIERWPRQVVDGADTSPKNWWPKRWREKRRLRCQPDRSSTTNCALKTVGGGRGGRPIVFCPCKAMMVQ